MAKKESLSYASLALLDWLLENGPGNRFVTTSGVGGMQFFDLTPVDENGKRKARMVQNQDALVELHRRFTKASPDTTPLTRLKYLTYENSLNLIPNRVSSSRPAFQKLIDQLGDTPAHYSSNIYLLTKQGFDFWNETGKAEFEAMRTARAAAEEAAARTIIIATDYRTSIHDDRERIGKLPKGFVLPFPRLGFRRAVAVATVIKETGSRFYVKPGYRAIYAADYGSRGVQGRAPQLYVDRADVLLDHASPAAVQAIIDADIERIAQYRETVGRAFDAMLPALQELASRIDQQAAMHDDMMKEILERYRAPDEDATPAPRL